MSGGRGSRKLLVFLLLDEEVLLLFKMFIQEFSAIFLQFTIFFMDRYCVRTTVFFT
jgi:hypothetical protein